VWVCGICGSVIYQCYYGGTGGGRRVPRCPFDRLRRLLGRTKCGVCRGSGGGGGGGGSGGSGGSGRRYRSGRRTGVGGSSCSGSSGGGGSGGGGSEAFYKRQ